MPKNLKSNIEVILQTTKDTAINKMDLVLIKDNKYNCVLSVPHKNASVFTTVNILERKNGIISIQLDSIKEYEINGGFFSNDKNNIAYLETLKLKDFEALLCQRK